MLLVQLTGCSMLSAGGASIELDEGDWCVSPRAGALALEGVRSGELMLLATDALWDGIPSQARTLARRGPLEASDYQMVSRHLGLIGHDAAAIIASARFETLSAAIIMVNGALRAAYRSRLKSSWDLLVGRAKSYIDLRLGDPELSVANVAKAMKCSKRYLHAAFSHTNGTVARYIWRQRLDQAFHDLANPKLAKLSITEVAMSRGFSSSAHFSRMFKERYGVSPRERRGGLGSLCTDGAMRRDCPA